MKGNVKGKVVKRKVDREVVRARHEKLSVHQRPRARVRSMLMLDRDSAEHLLGFSSNTANGVSYEELVRAATELRDLRIFRNAYEDFQESFKRVRSNRR